MAYVTIDYEFDIRDCDFDDEELIEELESRNYIVCKKDGSYYSGDNINNCLIQDIWMLRRQGKDYQNKLDELIYKMTGKLV